ncbi:hypothetical protein [Streptomyces sp. NPDC058304]|uniref:hypothetical protein n=1 Tax=Streptomyces sp. NPDC058304 TaxID=3346437 RepID=UPI0036EE4807
MDRAAGLGGDALGRIPDPGSSRIAGSTLFGDEGVVGVGYYGLGAPLRAHDLVLSGALFLTCAGLAAYRPSPLRRRSYGWFVPVRVPCS